MDVAMRYKVLEVYGKKWGVGRTRASSTEQALGET